MSLIELEDIKGIAGSIQLAHEMLPKEWWVSIEIGHKEWRVVLTSPNGGIKIFEESKKGMTDQVRDAIYEAVRRNLKTLTRDAWKRMEVQDL